MSAVLDAVSTSTHHSSSAAAAVSLNPVVNEVNVEVAVESAAVVAVLVDV